MGGLEAVAALRRELPAFAKQRLWTGPKLRKGETIEEITSPTTATVDLPGTSKDALVVSAGGPMAVGDGNGGFKGLDLTLAPVPGGWSPERSAGKDKMFLGEKLRDGLRLGEGKDGLTIKPRGDGESRGVKRGSKLFYPNTSTDTDVLAEPVATGLSVSYALRSPAAGQELVLDLDVPAGVKVVKRSGALAMMRDQTFVGTVTPPVAFDAQDTPVRAEYRLVDGGVAIDVDHRGKDLAYPIAVDPVAYLAGGTPFLWESGYPNPGTPGSPGAPGRHGYGYSVNPGYEPKFSPWDNGSFYGILLNGNHGGGGSAWWAFTAPRQSFIFRADFAQVAHQSAGSCLNAGVYGQVNGWAETNYGAYFGGSAPTQFQNCPGMGSLYVTTCVDGAGGASSSPCEVAGSPTNVAAVQVIKNSFSTLGGGMNFAGGYLYLRDYEQPSFPQGWNPNQNWTNNPNVVGSVQFRDPGLGMRGADITHNSNPASSLGVVSCSGDYYDPCPEYATFNYNLTFPDDGINTLRMEPYDIILQRNVSETRYIRIDREAPKIKLYGQLAARKDRVVAEDTRLRIKATDGTTTQGLMGRRSGTQSISGIVQRFDTGSNAWVTVTDSDALIPGASTPCATDSCELSTPTDFIFKPKLPGGADRPSGQYRVQVTACDMVNNCGTETLPFELGTGSMLSVIDGQHLSRYIPLQAAGLRAQTAVKFQYRRPVNDPVWRDVPITQLKTLNGLNAVSTATVPLTPSAASNNQPVNETLVWDLTQTDFEQEPVEVVAVFSGGGGGRSDDMRVNYNQSGLGSADGQATVGEFSVDVVTGNVSTSTTDASGPAYKADLSISRTYNSRDSLASGQQPGPFGPGWSTPMPTLGDAPDYLAVAYEPATIENYGTDDDPYFAVEPGSATVEDGDGELVVFDENSDDLGGFRTEIGMEHLRLVRNGPSDDPTGFTLTDRSADREYVYTKSSTSDMYTLNTITDLSTNTDKALYQWQTQVSGGLPRLKRVVAPSTPGGASCNVASLNDTPAVGCRWMAFDYGTAGDSADRVTQVTYFIREASGPATGSATSMASYQYWPGGRLKSATDLRANTRTDYEYDGDGLLSKVTPNVPTGGQTAGDRPWQIVYGRQTWDRGNGRVESVTRSQVPVAGGTPTDATTNVRWSVPVAAHPNGSPDLQSTFARTGQVDLPVDGTAIVPPGAQTYEWWAAQIHYFNPAGRIVNVAAPGGRIATTEYDVRGNAVRSLTPQNRADAFSASGTDTPAQEAVLALKRSTISQYCQTGPGSRVSASWGPERTILDGGTQKVSRTQQLYTYGLAATCPATAGSSVVTDDYAKKFGLATAVESSALTGGTAGFETTSLEPMDRTVTGGTKTDARTTTTAYHPTLLVPELVRVDPNGKDIQTRTIYDTPTGLVLQQRMPADPGDGTGATGNSASTRETIYYTADASSSDALCRNKPEWATLPCVIRQRGTVAYTLQSRITSYDTFGRPLIVQETAPNSATPSTILRTKTTTYRPDGQVATTDVDTPGVSGDTDVKQITRGYDVAGRLTTTATSPATQTLTRTYDSLGRLSTYQDGDGITTTTGYDLRGRVKETFSSDRPTQKRTNTFDDSTTGDLTSVNDPDVGVMNGEYDADGRLTAYQLATSGARVEVGFDAAGQQVKRVTRKATGCSTSCIWDTSDAIPNGHGQTAVIRGTNPATDIQEYSYDEVGRLIKARDTKGGQCTVRVYAFAGVSGKNSNRTTLTTKAPGAGGVCNEAAAGSSATYAYQAGDPDRLISTTRGSTTSSGFVYDALGRSTDVPASDAGGSGLASSFYENDLVRSMVQKSKTTVIDLDPALRPRARTVDGGTPEVVHYGDDSDEPLFTEKGSVKTREVQGLDGDLVASKKDSDAAATLAVSNVHGDVVGEAPNTSASTGPATTWRVDEFGVPRNVSIPAGPAVIERVGVAKAQSTTNVTSLTITKPAGVQTGDLLLGGLAVPSGSTVTPPAGWSAVAGGEVVSGASKWKMFFRYAVAAEPASYAFGSSVSGKVAGGVTALRNTAASSPVNAVSTWSGSGSNVVAASVTPTQNGSAIELLVGGNVGDNNGGEAWGVVLPLRLDWSTATGASAAGNLNAGMALRVLTGGANTATGTFTVSNLTGQTVSNSLAAVTAAITPATVPAGSGPQALPKYAYLGAKQRSTTLDTGVIEMGARIYVPQLGRFLQTDPVYGGSANAYDYTNQDPVNQADLDGRFAFLIPPAVVGVELFVAAVTGTAAVVVVAAATREEVTELLESFFQQGIINFSPAKGGKKNIRDTGLKDLSPSELNELYKNPGTPPSLKARVKTEQKARRLRNKQKRGNR